jgi:FAD-binding domain
MRLWLTDIQAASLLILSVVLGPLLRQRYYELFLRLHQALAAGVAACTVLHLLATGWLRWPLLYAYGGLVLVVTLFQLGRTIYMNKRRESPLPRIALNSDHGTITATITVPRPIVVEAGQYINIWVPSVSLFSSHPFTVVSWSPDPVKELKLFIQQRKGFTSRLQSRAELHSTSSSVSRMLFSGPHGSGPPVWDYEHILFFVQDYGIAAALPHLQKLVLGRARGHNKPRRVHVLWHVHEIGMKG